MTLRSLRRAIGVISQDPFLFSATVRDNIAFGVPGPRRGRRGKRRGWRRRTSSSPPAGRLRHDDRRARDHALRRPAAAGRDRAGARGRPAHPHPRRRDRLRRRDDRGAHPRRPGRGDEGPDDDRHRAPALDDRARGRDRRARPWADRRARDARRAARAEPGLPRDLRARAARAASRCPACEVSRPGPGQGASWRKDAPARNVASLPRAAAGSEAKDGARSARVRQAGGTRRGRERPGLLVRLARPYGLRTALAVCHLLFFTLVALAPPYLAKLAVDEGISRGDLERLTWIVVLFLVAGIGTLVLSSTQTYLTGWVGERVLADLRERLFAHLQRLSLGLLRAQPHRRHRQPDHERRRSPRPARHRRADEPRAEHASARRHGDRSLPARLAARAGNARRDPVDGAR